MDQSTETTIVIEQARQEARQCGRVIFALQNGRRRERGPCLLVEADKFRPTGAVIIAGVGYPPQWQYQGRWRFTGCLRANGRLAGTRA